jgi:hypothetical protein
VEGHDATVDVNSLKLHAKHVTPIDLGKLCGLPSQEPAAKRCWLQALGWLNDPERYHHVAFDGRLPGHRMLKGDIPVLLQDGVLRRLRPGERARGSVRVFFVVELHKLRRRGIKWTKDVNDAIGRETLQKLPIGTRAELRRSVLTGGWAIVVDGKQWFDQFPLSDEVGLYMCFDPSDGQGPACLSRLAMGQRHASEVGTAALRRLLDFDRSKVTVDYAADNVRFIGRTKQDVLSAFIAFAQRCHAVGAQLNEIDVAAVVADPKLAETLLTQKYDFMGETYDHTDNTMCSTEKTIGKLRTTWARREGWTNRQMAAHYGVLFYASSTARVGMTRYHSPMRYYAEAMTRMQANPAMWDEPAKPSPPQVAAQLEEWTNTVLKNEPVPIPNLDAYKCRYVICTDASGVWGWSAVCIDLKTDQVMTHCERWSVISGLRGSGSTLTEPQGILRGVRRFIRPDNTEGVLVLTDHSGVVPSADRGYAKSFAYNQMVSGFQDFNCPFALQHIPGEKNPVD